MTSSQARTYPAIHAAYLALHERADYIRIASEGDGVNCVSCKHPECIGGPMSYGKYIQGYFAAVELAAKHVEVWH